MFRAAGSELSDAQLSMALNFVTALEKAQQMMVDLKKSEEADEEIRKTEAFQAKMAKDTAEKCMGCGSDKELVAFVSDSKSGEYEGAYCEDCCDG